MLRIFFTALILATASILAVTGFRGDKSSRTPIEIFPDMDHQPKLQPQHPSPLFADGRAARQPVPGTIPLGYNLKGSYLQPGAANNNQNSTFPNVPDYKHTGKLGEVYGDGLPVDVTPAFLKRGEERYHIYCSVCHDASGSGAGVVKQYGLVTIASLLDQRIVDQPDGQIYNTITHGKNTMGAYGPNIAVEDRWAIVAYVRTLQRARNAKVSDLPTEMQKPQTSK